MEALSDCTMNVPKAQTNLEERESLRKDVADAIRFAQAKSALYFDPNHEKPNFVVGESAYVNVNRRMGQPGYRVSGVNARSLGPQRVGPYRILRQVGKLAYELELPPTLRIHPVISVTHLEKGPKTVAAGPPPAIIYEDGENQEGEFEVEAILAAEVRGRGRNRQIHYLVKWVGYGPDQNEWVPKANMEGARDLVEQWHNRHPIINGAQPIGDHNVARPRRHLVR